MIISNPNDKPVCSHCKETWCTGCDTCHACEGSGVPFHKEDPINMASLFTIRTQKAAGIYALRQSALGTFTLASTGLIQSDEDVKEETISALFPYGGPKQHFARPCPIRPRHGFVESRIIKTADELIALWKETREADPEGELLLMPPINASHNAIWTPGMLTVGSSNDGATAGRDAISFPLVPVKGLIAASTLKDARIDPDGWPYIEAVAKKGIHIEQGSGLSRYFSLTQLRSGPALESVDPDWLPFDGTVSQVLVAKDQSLLEWESLILSSKDQPGTVVKATSLTDHYAVHARTCGIPLFTSHTPAIGETFEKNTGKEIPYDRDAFLRGVAKADLFPIQVNGYLTAELTALMILCLHNAPVLRGAHTEWLGIGVGLMMRLGSAALRGEARHYKTHVLGKGSSGAREKVYTASFSQPLSRQRVKLTALYNLFRYGSWTGSVGGHSWAKCALSIIPLFNHVREIARGEENFTSLILAFNTALNQAHNNGWWMNKFSSKEAFDEISKSSIPWTLGAGRVIHSLGHFTDKRIPDRIASYADWAPVTTRAPRITSAVLVEGPSLTGGSIVVRPSLARIPLSRQIILTPQVLMKLFVEEPVGKKSPLTFSYTSEGRMRLEHTTSGTILWEEEELSLASPATK